MRKSLALGITVAMTTALAALIPAAADAACAVGNAQCADTTATFTVASGGISINAPSSVSLTGAGATLGLTAGSVTGTITGVQVTDNRGGLALNGWQASVQPTANFSDGSGHTVPASGGTVLAAPTNVVGLSGLAAAVPDPAVTLSTGGPLIHVVASVGSDQVTYNAVVTVSVPTSTVPGTYSTVIEQTVV